jgi:hypothetical protein
MALALVLALALAAPARASSDFLGTNQSKFFPIGIWYEGNVRDASHLSAPPQDSDDAVRYYEETFAQLKSWGLNVIAIPNNTDAHAKRLLEAADRVGGLNIVVETAATRDFTGTDAQAQALAQSLSTQFSSHTSLLRFQLRDEPPESMQPALRRLSRWISLSDSRHPGFGAICCNLEVGTDKMMAFNELVYDVYPLGVGTPVGDVPALESWGSRVDDIWRNTPRDKPFWLVIQAYSAPGSTRFPTPEELRYMTYSALVRGARGIFWFMYQTGIASMAGVVDMDSHRHSFAFPVIPRMASELKVLAPWLVEAERDDPSRNGRTPIASVPSQGSADFDLSSFRTASGERLIGLVNQHVESARSFHVVIDKARVQDVLGRGTLRLQELVSGAWVVPTETATTLEFDAALGRGEGKFFRLVGARAAEVRIPRGAYHNPLVPGRSTELTVSLKNVGHTAWLASSHRVGVHVYTPGGGYVERAVGVTGGNLPSDIAPGQGLTLTLSVPTGSGTSLPGPGTYQLGVDLAQDGGPWFGNEQRVSVMLQPTHLLVDTFDSVPFEPPPDSLRLWNRTGFMSIRDGALAVNGQEVSLSRWGSTWGDYTAEFDVMIDPESPADSAFAGWVFRALDERNGYLFNLAAGDAVADPNRIRRHKLQNGVITLLGSVPTGRTIQKGRWYHIKQELAGSTLRTFIDGTLVDTWTDSTFRQGRFGVRLSEGNGTGPSIERGHFDNVNVYTSGTDTRVPAQVTGLKVTPSGTGLALEWNPAEDADTGGAFVSHYQVHRDTLAGFVPSASNRVARPARNGFTDTQVSPGTVYHYKVIAVGANGVEGLASSEATGTARSPPAAVGGLTATAQGMKTVELSWAASGSAVRYTVHRAESATFQAGEDNRIATVTGTRYVDTTSNTFVDNLDTGLLGLKRYTYQVVPVDAAGNRGTAASTSVTTGGGSLFSDTFTSGAAGWRPYAGTWAVEAGEYSQGSTVRTVASSGIDGRRWANFVAEFRVRILDDGGDSTNWAGIHLHKVAPSDPITTSGYVLYYRNNGRLELYNREGGVVAWTESGLRPDVWRNVRVDVKGFHLRVYVDGIKFLDWSDPNRRWDRGYTDLVTYGAHAHFDDVNVFFRETFTYDYLDGWTVVTGDWGVDLGQAVLGLPSITRITLNENRFADFTADFALRMESDGGNGLNWAGVTFRKGTPGDWYGSSGYIVYYRSNGRIELHSAADGPVAAADTGLRPLGRYRHVRVEARGNRFKVYVEGVLRLDWTDPNNRYASGYVDLNAELTRTRFEYLELH